MTPADLTRAMLESELRAKSSVSLAFQSLQVQAAAPATYAQSALFGTSITVGAQAPACDHRGTSRDVQATLTGDTDTVCGRCGGIVYA